jgi:hypothetical protein
MSSTYIECFNNKLDEFLKDLVSTFPEMNDIKVLRNGLQLAKTIDPKLPQSVFNEHVVDVYEQRILDKDENFFLEEECHNIANKHGLDLDIMSKLKDIWTQLDKDNKEVIWKYLHVLVLLNRKCK